jgi:hypothetical protein
VIGDDAGRDVRRPEDELQLERQPAAVAEFRRDPGGSRQETASSILLGSSSERFIAIRNVRAVARGDA